MVKQVATFPLRSVLGPNTTIKELGKTIFNCLRPEDRGDEEKDRHLGVRYKDNGRESKVKA